MFHDAVCAEICRIKIRISNNNRLLDVLLVSNRCLKCNETIRCATNEYEYSQKFRLKSILSYEAPYNERIYKFAKEKEERK